ncbi:UNVERIFIED_CONTAM: CRS2-associated factor 2, mitochondrial [Sesamum radiatum]|uniref:CRS2-associated factor 2, mitochondrial n=1 Tax=Sesamum radiatum TaxID=300843 RepID=A0AAW2T3C8_SESRA
MYDPPFSPTPTQTPKRKNKSKIIKKKKQTQKVANKTNSDGANCFPVKSELPFDFMYSYSETSPVLLSPLVFANPRGFRPSGRAGLIGNGLGQELRPSRSRIWRSWRRSTKGFWGSHSPGRRLRSSWRNIATAIAPAKLIWLTIIVVDAYPATAWADLATDKSGGKIIYRHINILLLYRGRNYDPDKRPQVPIMLWKPRAPIYPKLVKNVADGLTFEETKEMRNRGLNSPPLMKLTRNGVYVNVVERVRRAFETEEVVRLDCTHVGTSDCKKIGVKLRDVVPCVPLLFKDEQIILWKGCKKRE